MFLFKNLYLLKFFSYLCLSILLAQLLNTSIYTHSHQLENGVIITHAHPFDKEGDNAPLKSHKHTNIEYFVYDTLAIFIGVSIFLLALILAVTNTKNYSSINLETVKKFTQSKQNKSPPVKLKYCI